MPIQRLTPAFLDERGSITDILSKEPVDAATVITSRKGAVRGNHYHMETTQWVYCLDGKLKVLSRLPGARVQEDILEKGDLVVHVPAEVHTMIALEDTTFLVLTRGPRSGEDYESDTYRLAQPLEAP